MTGPHIQSGQTLPSSSIMDIAPTVLHLLDCPIPSEMDGHVLTDAICPVFTQEHPVQIDSQITIVGCKNGQNSFYSNKETKEIEERLKSLGYM